MKNSHLLLISVILITLSASCMQQKDRWTLKSPDQSIRLTVHQTASQLQYNILLKSGSDVFPVMANSPLGILREDADFTKDLKFIQSTFLKNIKESYQLQSGKKTNVETTYNELILDFETPEHKSIKIIFRAYNDGLAFCYEFPEKNDHYVRVLGEQTGFAVPKGKAWLHPYDSISNWSPGYETYYEGPMPVATAANINKNGWAFPALFETDEKVWILISESGFDGTYVASHLDVSDEGVYQISNPEKEEALGYYENTSYASLPLRTPWRVIIASDNMNTLMNSNLITHLAGECKLKDTSWIKPGRASWSWWKSPDSPQDYPLILPYIDMAAQMGWEYSLVDANWNIMKNGNLERLNDYARNKGVGLLLWYNSGGKHNVVSEAPRDLMDNRSIRREEFQRIHNMGIKGIKVDFFQSDKQRIMQQYIDILEDAAEYELLVNFHGCTLPRGWRRTYPNLMTMEAIRGGESYIFDREYPEKAPKHLAIAAFSRGVIGPTDYTPGGFANNTYPFKTTLAFELALPIIFESGITHFVDPPAALEEQAPFVIDFLKNIPVVWDELIYLDGYPGEYLVLARRKGDLWYLAAINAQTVPQQVNIDVSSLTISKQLNLLTDGKQARNLELKTMELIEGKLITSINAMGGFVAICRN